MSNKALEQIKYLMEEHPGCFSLLYSNSLYSTSKEICRDLSFSNVEFYVDHIDYSFANIHMDMNANSEFKELHNLDILQKDGYYILFNDGQQEKNIDISINSMTINKYYDEGISSLTSALYRLYYKLECNLDSDGILELDMTEYKDFWEKKENIEKINNRFEILDIR